MYSKLLRRSIIISVIRSNVFLYVALPLLLIALVFAFQISGLWQSHEQYTERSRLNEQSLGATLAASIAGSFKNIDLTLLSATDQLLRQQPVDKLSLNAGLIQLRNRIPSLLSLRITNASGDVVLGTEFNQSEKINVSDRSYFKQLKENPQLTMVISEPVIGRIIKKWVLICARRFNLPNGDFGGIVYGSIELEGMPERLSGKEIKLGNQDAFVLFDNNLNVIARYVHGRQDMQTIGNQVQSPNLIKFNASGKNFIFYVSNSAIDNVERIFYAQRISGQSLGLVIGLSVDDVLSGWWREARDALIASVIFAIVVSLSSYLIYRAQLRQQQAILGVEAANSELAEVLKFNAAILQNSPVPIGVYAASGQCVEANDALTHLVGTTREAILQQNFHTIETWKSSELLNDCLIALRDNCPRQREMHTLTSKGKQVVMDCRILPTLLNGEIHLLIQFMDLTESKLAENALRASEAHLRTLLRTIPDLVWLKNVDGVYQSCNAMFERFFGDIEINILGKTDYDFFDKERADFYRQHDRNAIAAGKPTMNEEWITFADDGHRAMLETTKVAVSDANGQILGVLGIARDVTGRKQLEDELREQAFHDALTRLPNRRLLFDRMERAMQVSKRQKNHVAVLFLDLDRFKALNDTHGHEAGDQLLVEISARLKRTVRETDTVARLGGDEFVVLLDGLGMQFEQAQEYVKAVADKVIRVLNEVYILGTVRHHSSVSIGIKLFIGETDPDEILKAADSAMYEFKKSRAR